MTSSEEDLRFLKEAVPQLQEYLLSNEMYWPLSGSLPRLTPGSLLLTLARLHADSAVDIQRLDAQVGIVRTKWRAALEKKAARELANRLRLWSQFLSDYIDAPEQNLESYRTEVRGRVILQLLLQELPDVPEKKALADLDGILKARLIPGEFLWDPHLQSVFPSSDFWFLYGRL
jgi:hypothetical protein